MKRKSLNEQLALLKMPSVGRQPTCLIGWDRLSVFLYFCLSDYLPTCPHVRLLASLFICQSVYRESEMSDMKQLAKHTQTADSQVLMGHSPFSQSVEKVGQDCFEPQFTSSASFVVLHGCVWKLWPCFLPSPAPLMRCFVTGHAPFGQPVWNKLSFTHDLLFHQVSWHYIYVFRNYSPVFAKLHPFLTILLLCDMAPSTNQWRKFVSATMICDQPTHWVSWCNVNAFRNCSPVCEKPHRLPHLLFGDWLKTLISSMINLSTKFCANPVVSELFYWQINRSDQITLRQRLHLWLR